MRRRELVEQYGIGGMRNVNDAEAGCVPDMGVIQDAAAVGPLLERHPLAAIAMTIEVIMADEDHVLLLRHLLATGERR